VIVDRFKTRYLKYQSWTENCSLSLLFVVPLSSHHLLKHEQQRARILFAEAAAHQRVQLLHHLRGDRQQPAGFVCDVERDTDVLVVQGGNDIGGEVTFHHFFPKYIEHAATAIPGHDCFAHLARIRTLRVGKQQRFGSALQVGELSDLVSELGHLPGAGWTNVEDRLAHQFEQRSYTSQGRRFASDKEGQRCGLGRRHLCRCVDKAQTKGACANARCGHRW
jgi:hypothetical protein